LCENVLGTRNGKKGEKRRLFHEAIILIEEERQSRGNWPVAG
jgi:hypothetical protein